MIKQSDLSSEIATKLSVIIMYKLQKPIMHQYDKLISSEKKAFNDEMNKYLNDLGESWQQSMEVDFNEICNKMLFSDSKYLNTYIPIVKLNAELIE